MLIASLFLLSSVTATGQQADDGGRRSRQLDLGLQDISYSSERAPTTIRLSSGGAGDVVSGYLPPVSSSAVPPKEVAEQSQQAFEYKSANSVDAPKFDVELTFYGLNISKPSRDLVPPFNDIEQEAATPKRDEIAGRPATGLPVTTPLLKQEVRASSPKAPKSAGDKAEATNDFGSYLPPQPEVVGAAQTSVAVVQPANQTDDHDHHHHHHEHHHHGHGDICADPFHAFLCAALKPRKRITGAFPEKLRGQSSFVQYQKVLPNFDRQPAPSNAFQNQYLPPPSASPSNVIQATYSPPSPPPPPPPTTTKRIIMTTTTTTTTTTPRPYSPPRILEPASSNDRFYLPPLTDNRIFVPSLINPASSNQVVTAFEASPATQAPFKFSTHVFPQYSATLNEVGPTEKPRQSLPPSTTPKALPTVSFVPEEPRVISTIFPLPSNEDGLYLPPVASPQPAASFVSTTKHFLPSSTVIPQSSVFVSAPTVTTFVPLPSSFNVIASQPKIEPLPVIISTTKQPPVSVTKLLPQPTASPVVVTKKSTLRPISTFASLPSNPDVSYLPPQPKFQPASNLISTTIKPTTTTKKPVRTTPKLLPQPSFAANAYLPPDPNYQLAAAQIDAATVAAPNPNNPFHHGRDLCTDPFHSFLCSGAKPRKRITGALPPGSKPQSSTNSEVRVKPEPSFQVETRVKQERPLEGSQTQTVGYQYPKPLNPFSSNALPSTVLPSTGYSYPKPDKIFPLPSQQKELKVTTTTTTTTTTAPTTTTTTTTAAATKKPEPVLRTSEAKVVSGYSYPKPEKQFPLPSQQTTTRRPPSSSTGYSYPKPQKPFPLPTERKEVAAPPAASPTTQVKGYQYPKPEQSLRLPERKGYSYPKPEKRLELPTETASKTLLPQSNSNLEALGNLGSAEFIPVNKLDSKREDAASRRFGERLKKRERRPAD